MCVHWMVVHILELLWRGSWSYSCLLRTWKWTFHHFKDEEPCEKKNLTSDISTFPFDHQFGRETIHLLQGGFSQLPKAKLMLKISIGSHGRHELRMILDILRSIFDMIPINLQSVVSEFRIKVPFHKQKARDIHEKSRRGSTFYPGTDMTEFQQMVSSSTIWSPVDRFFFVIGSKWTYVFCVLCRFWKHSGVFSLQRFLYSIAMLFYTLMQVQYIL